MRHAHDVAIGIAIAHGRLRGCDLRSHLPFDPPLPWFVVLIKYGERYWFVERGDVL